MLQAIVAEGDTVRTIVKFLSQELSKGREAAVSVMFELSKSEALCEKIGSIRGAIILLVGLTSSKSENVSTVDKADQTLTNLERSEENVRQMATNGRLQPLLAKLLEGDFTKPLLSIITNKLIFSDWFLMKHDLHLQVQLKQKSPWLSILGFLP